MSSLYSFLMSFEPADDDGIEFSAEAHVLIASGVTPCDMYSLAEDTYIRFSSRLPARRAYALAQRYVKARFGENCQICRDDDYDFRGYFSVKFTYNGQ
jgi:hypothetical protein